MEDPLMKITLDPKLTGAPEYISCNSIGRGVWINLLLWCAEQENSGIIPGAASWSDEAWGMLGVVKENLRYASSLLGFTATDVYVWGYPRDQEDVIKAKRAGGKKGGLARVNNSSLPSIASSISRSASSTPSSTPSRSPSTPSETDEVWLAGLKNDEAYNGINIAIEHAKCARWCQANKKVMSRRRFINWLNKAERPMHGPLNGALMR
jgi:hypothetical protein